MKKGARCLLGFHKWDYREEKSRWYGLDQYRICHRCGCKQPREEGHYN